MDNIKAKTKKITAKQKKFLETFKDNLGVVSQSCEEFGISRQTFYDWKKDNQTFAAATSDISEVALDFVENMAFERIKEKSDTMIIFYLKTKGKSRGYIEKQEIEHGGTIQHNLEGKINLAIEMIYGNDDGTR